MFTPRSIFRVAALLTLPAIAAAQARTGATQPAGRLNQYGYPEKLTPRPTTAAITAADLMTRLYIFADDSMQGRDAPLESNRRGNAYIVRELTRLGLRPAGDHGTFLQQLPYVRRSVSPRSSLTAGDDPLAMGTDFTVSSRGMTKIVGNVRAVYGGVAGDASLIPAEQANNRFVVVMAGAPAAAGGTGGRGGGPAGTSSLIPAQRYAGAMGIATITSELTQAGGQGAGRGGGAGAAGGPPAGPPPVLANPRAPRVAAAFQVTPSAAERIFGKPVAMLVPGDTGRLVSANIMYDDEPMPGGANVVAIIPGSDSVLRREYVAVGSHNDHVGIGGFQTVNGQRVVPEHDSLRAARMQMLGIQIAAGDIRQLTPEEQARVSVNLDSLRRTRPARLDSIRNGADDDGSGSMAMLEIAEAIVRSPVKPKRSILFVWHTAEEDGLVGSAWYTDNPTVPLHSIVAQINMDMIGRGRTEDVIGGGPDYLGMLGASRLSTELGVRVEEVNKRQAKPLALDARFDRPITWQGYNNIYGRSDHANYARYNIPIVFFFTGLHADYHQVTDEPQYIDYPHYARIVQFVHDLAVDVGNMPKRPTVDRSGAPPLE